MHVLNSNIFSYSGINWSKNISPSIKQHPHRMLSWPYYALITISFKPYEKLLMQKLGQFWRSIWPNIHHITSGMSILHWYIIKSYWTSKWNGINIIEIISKSKQMYLDIVANIWNVYHGHYMDHQPIVVDCYGYHHFIDALYKSNHQWHKDRIYFISKVAIFFVLYIDLSIL